MKRFFFICLLIASLGIFTNCVRDIDQIGLNLQDGSILLGNNFFDTTTVIAYSTLNDSITTKKLANCVVGCVNDPVFGRTVAGFYTQFELESSSVKFGDHATLDSVCLSLRYAGFFGDTLSPITLQVYELNEALDDSIYYAHSTSLTNSENQTYKRDFTLYPRPTTRIAKDTGYVPAYFSIRLKDAIGQRFLDNQSSLGSTSDFQQFFKGLYITAKSSSSTGNLIYISLTAALSGLEIHYKDDKGLSKSYTFPIGKNSTYYTHYDHNDYNNASSDFKKQVINGNKELGNQVLYAQATGGVKTTIQFPNLDKIFPSDAKVIINKAELVITNISDDASYYYMPYNLSLQAIGNKGALLKLPDDASLTSAEYFGGTYDEKKKEYRFRITKYVQQLLLHSPTYPNNGINLVVSGAGVRGNRLVFCGPNPGEANKDKRLRLEIYYTTY